LTKVVFVIRLIKSKMIFNTNMEDVMTGKQALSEISKYGPCPHDNADTSLGNGKIWAKCDSCGETFAQENWQRARDAAQRFDDAVARLTHLVL
jgi:ribosomal protein L37AE/L43A